jgi:biopolymer transport protein ExbD
MSRGRKFKIEPAKGPNSDINVTPLVDVVLVLLIIFMVVTPLLEKDIDVRVPDTDTTDTPPDQAPDNQLVVQLNEKGEISINTHPVNAGDEYINELRKLLRGKSKDDRLVFFLAEDKANYGKLIGALDGARQAGAETLGMMTEQIEGAGGGTAPPAPGPAPDPAPK